jgi:hypothetical protein
MECKLVILPELSLKKRESDFVEQEKRLKYQCSTEATGKTAVQEARRSYVNTAESFVSRNCLN